MNALVKKMYSSKLVKSGIWYTIGTFFLQGIGFLTLPIFNRLLSPTENGVITIYTTYVGVFTILIGIGLESAVSRGRFDFKEDYEEFLSSLLFLASITFVIWLSIGIIFKNPISNMIGIKPDLVILLIVQSFFGFVLSFASTKYSIEYKYKKFLFISITSTLINVGLSIILIMGLTNNRYYGRIKGGAYVTIIYGVILYAIFMIKGRKLIALKYWKYALPISLPMIFHQLSSIALTSSDAVMISKIVGDAETGIYGFAYKMGLIVSIAWAASNKAWVPWFFEKMKEENYDEISEKTKYYIILFSFITFILIFISPEIAMILGTKAYSQGIGLVPIIMIGYYFVFLYSLPVNLEFYTKKTKYIATGTFMAAVANIVLNLIFIPKFGYVAAGWTTVVSYLLLFLYHYIIALKISDVRVFNVMHFIYGILFIAVSSGIFYFIKDIWVIRYGIITMVCLITVFSFKKKIGVLLNR
ncbi:oligosaccharide flippase family protein [Clostridium tagluense]|uniref:lipopolysaccharide biosynthesis protein n=1 Tax=Clostridium tagluense TaxID=360422 RepID=UPI001CF12BCC|nr:oligosaccharide flippase family protein [Clostridium tagluense]MCB2311689.1 oligosaccharide flippase family protein [Clostridium tagluense]MCB2316413.1 oligosaccharide flippase family protein [Clostridium tagluense]MCB2321202.1 oligosaccharide flippase family protein [Clostridium tagluense]MCB2326282.1 oligosaccharide flippase family protein [Clostridium tagluense]MCB2330939.1 oligosaccharide flippase family protein [Clostridium tagluense]